MSEVRAGRDAAIDQDITITSNLSTCAEMAAVNGCLLVGSVPLADTETVFRDAIAGMPHRLKRMPDGETGERFYFTYFQAKLFSVYPPMMARFVDNALIASDEFTPEQLDEGMQRLTEKALETGYDTSAIDSYAVFKKLKSDGIIPAGVRFQVCIPTAANVIGPFIQRAFQARVYPVYEEALGRAVRNIQGAIPHQDLSIQIDLAVDTAFWEGVYMEPWFDNVKEFIVDYTTRMLTWIAPDVEVGLHNCYGDMEHKHWAEPTSLQAVSERGLMLLERGGHKIDYFHCPVPVSASAFLDEYMKPIQKLYTALRAQGGELFLGVVQHDDLEGSKRRIEAASKYLPEFGIATECGMGRTPKDQVENLFKLTTELSRPIVC